MGKLWYKGQLSARATETMVLVTIQTRFKETYAYFAREYGLSSSPDDDFTGTAGDASKS